MAKEQTEGTVEEERTEDKFICDKNYYIETKAVIEHNLDPYYPVPGVQYCLNRSTYFESPELTFLKQHLAGVEDRRKVRIRTYAPNGVWGDEYYAEIKYKSNGDSKKVRVCLDHEYCLELMNNYQIPITDKLLSLNPDDEPEDVRTKAKLINYIIAINKARPMVEITYYRNAYQNEETFRVTVDKDIKYKQLMDIKPSTITDINNQDLWKELQEVKDSFSNNDNFVLEVKYQDKIEDWFEELVEALDVEEQSFSKYVWSVANIIDDELSKKK